MRRRRSPPPTRGCAGGPRRPPGPRWPHPPRRRRGVPGFSPPRAPAGRSRLATPSLPQAVVAGFLIALCAGGLGAARAVAPWDRLARLLPPRPRSVVLGTAGSLAVLGVAGATLAGASLAAHLHEFGSLNDALGAGAVGSVLLPLPPPRLVPHPLVWGGGFTPGARFSVRGGPGGGPDPGGPGGPAPF